jgi:hypothetical protein
VTFNFVTNRLSKDFEADAAADRIRQTNKTVSMKLVSLAITMLLK